MRELLCGRPPHSRKRWCSAVRRALSTSRCWSKGDGKFARGDVLYVRVSSTLFFLLRLNGHGMGARVPEKLALFTPKASQRAT